MRHHDPFGVAGRAGGVLQERECLVADVRPAPGGGMIRQRIRRQPALGRGASLLVEAFPHVAQECLDAEYGSGAGIPHDRPQPAE